MKTTRNQNQGAAAVEITVNGRPVTATAGTTVGAALMSEGVHSWRRTRHEGRPRGLFCGIGVCFDCLVEVDGHPNQRACLVTVREGMAIEGAMADTDDPNRAERATDGVLGTHGGGTA
ncbi:(2Fe-2S)-binding protein [Citricoccus sp. I39-566]|uniref:(2Fe-2S)-binding protein n=1 Tax=Citricoccus sp. I39-566 TaxID=3073268 RepID=UPI00286A5C23|nr:(2Fe-2S)-binding protein [Citricoccus sp. I39-566]WMY78445.1 (2Fe-2S)-binding protein [Citricoccus sp. I39-566]